MSIIPSLPPNSFLAQYMKAMSVLETPTVYDFFGALWALGAAVGRSVVVARPKIPVYLNMYLLFISESGLSRKSTAIKMATDVLRPIMERTTPRLTTIENKVSAEFVISALTNHTQKHHSGSALIIASELASMMGRQSRQLPILLTDLYDCPKWRTGGGTLHFGETEIRDVFVSFIAGSTLSWLSRAVSPHIVEGGFTSRCFFIASDQRKQRIAWPDDVDIRLEVLSEQLYTIHEMGREIGCVTLAPLGRSLFERWYNERQIHSDPYRRSFEGREDDHILRVAGLLAINRGAWEIKEDQIASAISIVKYAKRIGASFFTTEVKKSQPELLLIRIIKILMQAGSVGLLQSRITLACNHIAKRDLINSTLDVMHEMGYIDRFDLEKAGKRGTMWRMTPQLRDRNVVNTIMNSLVTSEDGLDILNTSVGDPTAQTDQS